MEPQAFYGITAYRNYRRHSRPAIDALALREQTAPQEERREESNAPECCWAVRRPPQRNDNFTEPDHGRVGTRGALRNLPAGSEPNQHTRASQLPILHSIRAIRFAALISTLPLLFASAAGAQSPVVGRAEVFAGSELENYLRYIQTLGANRLYPWSIRAFSPREIDTLFATVVPHPWQDRYDFAKPGERISAKYVRPNVELIYNSAFPYGSNDGPVWAGRGLTSVFQAGIALRLGVLSITLAPEIFRAQNAAFPLMANGDTGRLRFADGQFPTRVDRPQRFGDRPYTVLDPGQSTIRIDVAGVTVGVSTANQTWGPANQYAYLISNNAAGYPHAFLGTAKPANLFLFHLHARMEWGILSQSHYSPVGGPRDIQSVQLSGTRRFMSGIVATIQPRGLDGLELGLARFFHQGWPSGGPSFSDFARPLESLFQRGLRPEPPLPGTPVTVGVRENQIASLFARWVIAPWGFEVYGEYGRDDHSANLRDLLEEPDHGGASRMLGIRKMWSNGYAFRAEGINFEAPPIKRFRAEGSAYTHSILRQGHTQRGQVLGADVGVGSGAGATIALDRYSNRGRISGFYERRMGHDTGDYYLSGVDESSKTDVLHSIGIDVLRFVGRVDLIAKAVLTANLNRNLSSDTYNLSVATGARLTF